MATRKKRAKKTDAGETARRVARKVIGQPKPARAIEPDSRRKKVKHKKDPLESET
jgi:hypothetical protein